MENIELKNSLKTISRHSDFLRNSYNVKLIGVFGSVARGGQKRGSDIDIVVELFEPIGFFKFIELENYLSKILHRKADLVTKKALKPAIRQQILKEVLYA